MSELPKPVFYCSRDDAEHYLWSADMGNAIETFRESQGDDAALFTADQVAELMERAAAYGDLYGHEEAGLASDFRAAYCKKADG